MAIKYVKPEKISLKNHGELNEKWVQEIIAQDPTILNLGELVLKDKERTQPHAGRLRQQPEKRARKNGRMGLAGNSKQHGQAGSAITPPKLCSAARRDLWRGHRVTGGPALRCQFSW